MSHDLYKAKHTLGEQTGSYYLSCLTCKFLFQKFEPAAKSQLKKWHKIWQREVNKASDKAQKDVGIGSGQNFLEIVKLFSRVHSIAFFINKIFHIIMKQSYYIDINHVLF